MESNTVFVKIEDYKDILEVMSILKNKVEDAKSTLRKINELKNEEDAELELWSTGLEDVERKIEYIDKLFEPTRL